MTNKKVVNLEKRLKKYELLNRIHNLSETRQKYSSRGKLKTVIDYYTQIELYYVIYKNADLLKSFGLIDDSILSILTDDLKSPILMKLIKDKFIQMIEILNEIKSGKRFTKNNLSSFKAYEDLKNERDRLFNELKELKKKQSVLQSLVTNQDDAIEAFVSFIKNSENILPTPSNLELFCGGYPSRSTWREWLLDVEFVVRIGNRIDKLIKQSKNPLKSKYLKDVKTDILEYITNNKRKREKESPYIIKKIRKSVQFIDGVHGNVEKTQ